MISQADLGQSCEATTPGAPRLNNLPLFFVPLDWEWALGRVTGLP